MKTIRHHWVLSLATLLFILMVVLVNVRAQAQNNQEVPPYEFASIPVVYHSQPVRVYKMVHQGCEIYITTNTALGHEAASIAIATGRGCK